MTLKKVELSKTKHCLNNENKPRANKHIRRVYSIQSKPVLSHLCCTDFEIKMVFSFEMFIIIPLISSFNLNVIAVSKSIFSFKNDTSKCIINNFLYFFI